MSNDEITKALTEPFPDSALKQRDAQGGGKGKLTYVDGTTVFRRLIKSTDNQFDVAVVDQDLIPFGSTKTGQERILLKARVRITIPGLGSREHVGVQVVNATSGGEDLWKGAVTDAIKKAATLFGVGLELYGPDYESDDYDPGQQAPAQASQGRSVTPPLARQASRDAAPSGGRTLRPRANDAPAQQDAPPQQDAAPPPQRRVLRRNANNAADQDGSSGNTGDEPVRDDDEGPIADKDGVLLPASDKQRNYMRGLYKGLGYIDEAGHTDMVSLDAFLRRDYNTTWDTLTMEEAKEVITTLKEATELGAETF